MGNYKIIDKGGVGGFGITILDPDGKDITQYVRSYTVKHEAGEFPSLTLEMYAVAVEAEVKPEQVEFEQVAADNTALADSNRSYTAVSK